MTRPNSVNDRTEPPMCPFCPEPEETAKSAKKGKAGRRANQTLRLDVMVNKNTGRKREVVIESDAESVDEGQPAGFKVSPICSERLLHYIKRI